MYNVKFLSKTRDFIKNILSVFIKNKGFFMSEAESEK